jgi:hypothetical protein
LQILSGEKILANNSFGIQREREKRGENDRRGPKKLACRTESEFLHDREASRSLHVERNLGFEIEIRIFGEINLIPHCKIHHTAQILGAEELGHYIKERLGLSPQRRQRRVLGRR